jgi:hypothetical protein
LTSRTLAAVAFLAAGAVLARAESRTEEDTTPLGLLRRAEAVVVATGAVPLPGEEAPLGVLHVHEVLRGPAKAGERILLAGSPAKEDLRAEAGLRVVAFLGRSGGRWEVLDGALGLVPGEGAFFRNLIGCLGKDGRIADPAKARSLLVAAAGGPSERLRHGAAFDLSRDPVLLGGATAEERAALVAAFEALPNRDRARFHLARVVGVLKPEGAAVRLATALVAEDGDAVADAIGPALADLGDPKAFEILAAKAVDPSLRVRRLVAKALGAAESPHARPGLEALLGAAEPAVRFEAAHGLGRLREPLAAPALLKRFGPEGDALVRKALAWALVRCGEYAAVDEASRADPDPAFRRYAEALLKNPARGFVR